MDTFGIGGKKGGSGVDSDRTDTRSSEPMVIEQRISGGSPGVEVSKTFKVSDKPSKEVSDTVSMKPKPAHKPKPPEVTVEAPLTGAEAPKPESSLRSVLMGVWGWMIGGGLLVMMIVLWAGRKNISTEERKE
jgi:hypothetical protein